MPLGWDGPPPNPKNHFSAPGLVKCQLLISSSGWAGSEAVAWARREIELIRNDNHRLSAFVRPEKVAVLSISQTIARLKVENSKCLGGFHLASQAGSWGNLIVGVLQGCLPTLTIASTSNCILLPPFVSTGCSSWFRSCWQPA